LELARRILIFQVKDNKEEELGESVAEGGRKVAGRWQER